MNANDLQESYLLGMVLQVFVGQDARGRDHGEDRKLAGGLSCPTDRETHEDLLAVITDEMSYAIYPDLTLRP